MRLQKGRLVIEFASTGERLFCSLELEAANHELEIAKDSDEKQAADMAAMIERYRERFGDLSENKEG